MKIQKDGYYSPYPTISFHMFLVIKGPGALKNQSVHYECFLLYDN